MKFKAICNGSLANKETAQEFVSRITEGTVFKGVNGGHFMKLSDTNGYSVVHLETGKIFGISGFSAGENSYIELPNAILVENP